eukprot:Nk52_evm30s234 gene=Nk52_evmTU30s234
MEGPFQQQQQVKGDSGSRLNDLYMMPNATQCQPTPNFDTQISDVWLNEVLEVQSASSGLSTVDSGFGFEPSPLMTIPENSSADFNDILTSIKEIRKETVESLPSSSSGGVNQQDMNMSNFSRAGSEYESSMASPAMSFVPESVASNGGTSAVEDEGTSGKKSSHSAAEKKRRNNIKVGIDELQAIIPSCKEGTKKTQTKQSKATVLKKAVDYISHLIKEKCSLVEEVNNLREEVAALKAVISKYQQMGPPDEAEFERSSAAYMQSQNIGDNIKFYLFCSVVDRLFETFNASISLESPEAFSSSLMTWFDAYCRPEHIRESFLLSLRTVGAKVFNNESAQRLRKWSGALNACKDQIYNQPMVVKIGETISTVKQTVFPNEEAAANSGGEAESGNQGESSDQMKDHPMSDSL